MPARLGFPSAVRDGIDALLCAAVWSGASVIVARKANPVTSKRVRMIVPPLTTLIGCTVSQLRGLCKLAQHGITSHAVRVERRLHLRNFGLRIVDALLRRNSNLDRFQHFTRSP